MTCDGRLFHRRATVTGNALSPTVDRRICRTSIEVDEAERTVVAVWSKVCQMLDYAFFSFPFRTTSDLIYFGFNALYRCINSGCGTTTPIRTWRLF